MQQHPRELASNWLEQAKRDIGSATLLAAGERYDAACFACQQGTRAIGVLIAEIASFRTDAVAALHFCEALDPYYVTTRYPDAIGGGIPGRKFFRAAFEVAFERATRSVNFAGCLLAPE